MASTPVFWSITTSLLAQGSAVDSEIPLRGMITASARLVTRRNLSWSGEEKPDGLRLAPDHVAERTFRPGPRGGRGGTRRGLGLRPGARGLLRHGPPPCVPLRRADLRGGAVGHRSGRRRRAVRFLRRAFLTRPRAGGGPGGRGVRHRHCLLGGA